MNGYFTHRVIIKEEIAMEIKINTKTIKIQDKDVEVRSYAPVEKKTAQIIAALMSGTTEDGKFFSRVAFEASLYVSVVSLYSDFFDQYPELLKDMELLKAYDILETNGVIGAIISAVEELKEDEIKVFLEYAQHEVEHYVDTFNSTAKVFDRFIDGIHKGLEEIQEYVEAIEKAEKNDKE